MRGAAGGDERAVGTRLAYGDIKAPSEVDTLRDEACPVCGETDAWDGDSCKVCGFVAPPDKFQDPDVDMHKQLDLRNNGDLDGGDVQGLNADINDRDGDGLDDNTGEPIQDAGLGGDDAQPMLVCPNCGYEAPAAEPQSVSTDQPMGAPPDPSLDPEQAMADEATDAVAEGDPCPNCGEGQMVGPETAAELGIGSGGMEEDPGSLKMGDPDAEPADPRDEDPADEDPADPDEADPRQPFQPRDPEDGEEQPEEDEDEEEPDREGDGIPDEHSDDSEEPARKKPFPGKK